ncbi:MAG: helicase-related protein, partial [Telluria sp.]
DRMLDMGFIHDIRKVLAVLPPKRQNLLFSATFSDEIKALADRLLDNPASIEVARRNSTVEVIAQKIHPVDRDKKHPMLAHLIKTNDWHQVLVFTRTKHGANKLVEQLGKDGIGAMAIHGNKSQSARTKALAEFKDGSLQVLVATDIAARGIDIDQLPHVVNYDLPNVPEDYVHRIGRTGRAGATGEAVSLVCVDEHQMLKDIEKLIKQTLPRDVIPGFEPDPTAKAQPIQLRSGDRGQSSRGGRPGGRSNGNGSGQRPAAAAPAARSGQPRAQGNGGQARTQGAGGQQRPAGGNGARSGNGNGQGARSGNRGPRPASSQRAGGRDN